MKMGNRDSVINFEDGFYKGKNLKKQLGEVEGRRNTLLQFPVFLNMDWWWVYRV